jgi:hypothetical protein
MIPRFSPAAFCETARGFYGARFVGEVAGGCGALRDVLARALPSAP